jgi:hypothetical protein
MEDSALATRNPRVVHSQLADGEAVLLHLETGKYHELNPMGGLIWDLLDGNRDVLGIAAELREQVEDAPEDLEEIIIEFLTSLRDRGLIT